MNLFVSTRWISNARICLIPLVVAIGIAALSGCTYPARVMELVPENYDMLHYHDGSVQISVDGGKETSMSTTLCEISNDVYREALTQAIKESGLFKEIPSSNGDYALHVTINNQEMGERGFADMDVDVMTSWELRDNKTSKVLWKDVMTTNYKATVSDAFNGAHRYRMAKEKAAQKNIQLGIQALSKLSL
jgi:hypothetical protein